MALCGYTKGRVLGRGSTATVSLASAVQNGYLLAVKSAALANSSSLYRERTIISSLPPSKHIVSYFGYDLSDDHYNLLLEYAPGGSLDHAGKLPEPAIRSRTREIVAGLALLHSCKVIHCDIKSQNILITADGKAMIADFGCAKLFDEKRPIGGTPMFMAPETARGEEQGPAADIWAVGCVVIEMATGRAPWPDASDAVSVLHRIAYSEDAPDAPDWMSAEGKDFLSKCLRRYPEERPSAEQLLEHPFLLNLTNSDSVPNWTSPKSILDQHVWESMEEAEESAEVPHSAIGELVGEGRPNWTWNDEWLTVRTNDDDDESVILDTDTDNVESDTHVSSSPNVVTVSENSGTSCNNVDYSEEFSGDNNEKDLIMFWSCNWIYGVFPVGNSLLSFAICWVVSCAFVVGSAQVSSHFLLRKDLNY